MMKKELIFIVYTRTKFSEPPRARHQFSEALSLHNNVVFIEANKTGFPLIKKSIINERFSLLSPYFPIDYRIRFRIPFFNEIYQMWLSKYLKRFWPNENYDIIYIIFDHTAKTIAKKFPNYVFYINDDHIRNYIFNSVKKFYLKSQNYLVTNSIFNVVTSQYLYDKFINQNKNTYLIKLGAPLYEGVLPINIKLNGSIRIVLVGYISKNNSIELMDKLFSANNVEIHIVGSYESKIKKEWSFFKNVHFDGIIQGYRLIEYLATFDVGIAPYSLADVNSGRTPNKLWLYLRAGLPVVVTELYNISSWEFPEKHVYKSVKNRNFIELIYLAKKQDSEILRIKRQEFAINNSWEHRVNEFLEILNNWQKNESTYTTT